MRARCRAAPRHAFEHDERRTQYRAGIFERIGLRNRQAGGMHQRGLQLVTDIGDLRDQLTACWCRFTVEQLHGALQRAFGLLIIGPGTDVLHQWAHHQQSFAEWKCGDFAAQPVEQTVVGDHCLLLQRRQACRLKPQMGEGAMCLRQAAALRFAVAIGDRYSEQLAHRGDIRRQRSRHERVPMRRLIASV
jgi:hypothetical protein